MSSHACGIMACLVRKSKFVCLFDFFFFLFVCLFFVVVVVVVFIELITFF